MQKEGLLDGVIVFCHRNSILQQWIESAKNLGIKLQGIDHSSSQEKLSTQKDGWVLTYQEASINPNQTKQILQDQSHKNVLAIGDEAHHLGIDPNESESPAWGKAFLEITKSCKLRLGLTGTPFRADNLSFCSAKKTLIQDKGEFIEQITPDLCIESQELIEAGDVRPLEFHFQDGSVEHKRNGIPNKDLSFLSNELRESWRARNLRRAIRLSDSSSIAVQILIKSQKKLDQIRKSHPNAAGLVIARDIEHANSISNFLKENGSSVELIHSEQKDASLRLANFKSSQIHWLVSIDMCSEGFDAPRIRLVAYMTTVVTKSRFLQGITRAVRMSTARASLESIPRQPSVVFAPADPLLMEYAKEWSRSKPYLISRFESNNSNEIDSKTFNRPCLPMEAIQDEALELIRIRTPELPNFM